MDAITEQFIFGVFIPGTIAIILAYIAYRRGYKNGHVQGMNDAKELKAKTNDLILAVEGGE